MQEVAQTTNYIGAKKDGDEGALERISTVDEDQQELERFWNECRAEVTQSLIGLQPHDALAGDVFSLSLEVSQRFNQAQLPSMQTGLFSYFVQSIVAKWCMYANKDESVNYAQRAEAIITELKEKAYHKLAPTRPTYSDDDYPPEPPEPTVVWATKAYVDGVADAITATIPTKTSDLDNNSGYITSASLPTKTSQLTNDSGYITTAALASYATTEYVNGLVGNINTALESIIGED